MQPSGSFKEDLGPFGHHDLFGSVCETTSTVSAGSENDPDGAAICNFEKDSVDPATFGDDLALRIYYCPAHRVSKPYAEYVEVGPFVVDPLETGLSVRGVRCAYDPADN